MQQVEIAVEIKLVVDQTLFVLLVELDQNLVVIIVLVMQLCFYFMLLDILLLLHLVLHHQMHLLDKQLD